MLNRSFTLGFTCCGLTTLSAFLIYIESGNPERGSGRDKDRILFARIELIASNNTHVGQQEPDRKPQKGNGRQN